MFDLNIGSDLNLRFGPVRCGFISDLARFGLNIVTCRKRRQPCKPPLIGGLGGRITLNPKNTDLGGVWAGNRSERRSVPPRRRASIPSRERRAIGGTAIWKP